MLFRSSSGSHTAGEFTANVDSSHGVHLDGGSSGAIVEPAGDDANIAMRVRGKGTGGVLLGNSSSPVTIGSSGSAIAEVRRFTVQFTAPNLSSGLASAAESTYTVAGVSTGTVLMFTPIRDINALYTVRARCSSADELILAWGNIGDSTLGGGESSNRGTLLQFKF